jgi:transient receptor potential cation channel subfamily M protein 2
MTQHWGMKIPKLLISVTGGARRFFLRDRHKSILIQGIINAAVSTGKDKGR